MTTNSGFQADIASTAHAPTAPGPELVNKFIAYYSTATDAAVLATADALSHSELPGPATPAPSTPVALLASTEHHQMRSDKNSESSGQSTDTELAGNGRSSESSSSMGDSAAAAARVLAALQDRTGGPSGSPANLDSVASSIANGSNMWQSTQGSAARVHSSTSTPRHNHATFSGCAREGSAPLPGAMDAAGQRRPDMGFLALLNSAAAYVAESSSAANPATNAHHSHSSDSHRTNNSHNRQQQQHADSAYLAHNDMLSASPLTLTEISQGFGHVGGASGAQSGFSAQYDAALSNAAYRDLAQALQHIAATTTGSNGALLATGTDTHSQHSHFSTQPVEAHAAQINHLTASAVNSDQIVSSNSQAAVKNNTNSSSLAIQAQQGHHYHHAPATGSSSLSSGSTKRKRKDGGSGSPQQTPAKRKASHAPDQAKSTPNSEIRRAARKWTEEETENLLQGCSKYGVGAWKKILDDSSFTFNNRTSVDLKDRFRTIRAQECAHSPYQKGNRKNHGKEPDVVWPLPPNSQRLQGLQRVQRKPTRNYTNDEDRRLLIGVLRHANHWTKIAADPDLKLGDRPGQSLRDRLRNAFPEVFELFGYVIPKKERADRERHTSPGPHPAQEKATTPKRKAPTGSKRLDGDIPDHIRNMIMFILSERNASLDPHPIPEEDGDSSYDADADADADANADRMSRDDLAAADDNDSGLSAMSVDTVTPSPTSNKSRASRKRSVTVASGSKSTRNKRSNSVQAAVKDEVEAPDTVPKRASSRKKSTTQRRNRSKSKGDPIDQGYGSAVLASAEASILASVSLDPETNTAFTTTVTQNDGGIHSAPTHGNNNSGGLHLSDLSAMSDTEQRRSGTISAGSFGAHHHRNFLLDSFAPSVFSRPVGVMTPTDQLDALALEGRIASGYSTPTQSTKRRHSVQADFNDAMAAAAAIAAGMDRSSYSSALNFFHSAGTGLDHSAADVAGSAAMHLGNPADTMRRMTVDGQINPDAFLFPRLPDDDVTAAAAAAAAAAVAVDMSAPISTNQSNAETAEASTSDAASRILATTVGAVTTGMHNPAISVDTDYKLSATATSVEQPLSASALMNGTMSDSRDDLLFGHRGQLRSAQRLLRENGVADDNSIGLSTTSAGDSRVDLEALTQFSQWFPNFASSNLGWNLGGSSSHIGSGSIDPNMLNAGLTSSATMAAPTSGADAGGGAGVGGDGCNNAAGSNVALTHARRRSQFDWYGLTPSLAAALDAANTTVAAAAAAAQAATSDTSGLSSLGPFGIGQSTTNPSYRRPSMPIFPSFAYPPSSDFLNLPTNALHGADIRDGMASEQSAAYNTANQDGATIAEAAAAAAAAVAVALGDGPESLDHKAGIAGPRSYSVGAGSEIANKTGIASGLAPMVTTGGSSNTTSAHTRRRTMHVPPSLIEGVATSNFGADQLNRASAISSSGGSGGSIIRALNLHTQPLQQPQQNSSRRSNKQYPPRLSSGALKPVAVGATRVRRSRTIGSGNKNGAAGLTNSQQEAASPAAGTSSTLPAVSEAASSPLTQFPPVPAAFGIDQQNTQQQQFASLFGSVGAESTESGTPGSSGRHRRTLSGTEFTQDAISAFADISPGFLAGIKLSDNSSFGFSATNGLASSSQPNQHHYHHETAGGNSGDGRGSKDGDSMDVDLEMMTSLSTGAAAIDFSSSFKPYLWTSTGLGDDGLNGASIVDETRSLADIHRDASGSVTVDLYRPASLTPTGRHRHLNAIGGSANAGSESAPAVSPVAPRSAASTPGRREAVGI
ncbi:hypothetical protein GGI25_001495 [Coemansia spiralis]|uniref:Myb-like domain-containing protein n=2 Tax=Coemansia TaxID=4863 RepID=A0A9W8L069_9FUNG|nr:hypothetical protein EDC05_001651 [Coemansia umbellata]KAJ2624235.1 hypothetical protein GGI26_001591 [Coemansia sp. RSA 1358]KAJ2679360.1 hypothetical protein GGI25_001495 [Coemansia spiralis]